MWNTKPVKDALAVLLNSVVLFTLSCLEQITVCPHILAPQGGSCVLQVLWPGRRAGGRGPGVPWREERTVAAFVCRWKGLQVLTAMINHPEADIWIQPGKRFNFLIHPAHNLFTPAVGAGFPHLPALSSRWPLPHAVFLSPFTPRVIIWGRSCCNCGGCLDNALFLLEMGFFLLCGRTVNWLC